ncbi:MAG TPA: two-component system response regulator [Desulfobacter sp.]|uniref:response regulator n=1 Tax=Desulfobacter sp. UBA2225 TaxID=1961413 RepID=UPI000E99C403|nr:response regulator [Desulfobacter sp. UBA2225]HAR34918.1 two-component system response regulator [Desulfobacter sp.]
MKKANVLIVDDSRSALFAVKALLNHADIHTVTASDALQGQEALKKEQFDLVITDVDMPNLNGLDFCKWIKSNPETAHIPVIVLSSLDTDIDIENGFRVGADAYVPKRLANKELIPHIESVMDKCTFVKDKTILVVEDSKTIQMVTKQGLEDAGFKVVLADDGQHALDIIDDVAPDILLTDLNMPRVDGNELCRRLFNTDKYEFLPIVVMSSLGDKSMMRRLIRDGVAAFIVKPFNVDMLVVTMEKLLSDHFQRMLEERERLIHEQKLTIGFIASLVNVLEARDKYTSGHSEAVTRLAIAIGRELGFKDQDMNRLQIAASLHDIGKIGIRDNVLLKPGKLTMDEFKHIQTHTVIIQNILKPLPGMEDVLVAASSHHERWDGTGYPNGLKGEDIPLFGRIIAVADVFHALTGDRPYRDGMSSEKALQVISDGVGSHFCPTVAAAFFRYIKTLKNDNLT